MLQTPETDASGGLFQELVMQIGLRNACRLCASKGGRSVYLPVPENLSPDHWLVELLGTEDAAKVAGYMGGAKILLPLGPYGGQRGQTRLGIKMALANGHTVQQIAAMFGVTTRTVRRHKNGPAEHAQAKTDESKELIGALQKQARQIEATPIELIEVMRRLLRRVPKETLERALQRIRQDAAGQSETSDGPARPQK
ncbi:MAG: helix-turn-helix domain-containing protein [Solidesulfovibrio sp.]|uniref:helix-turn-helix domain-containing protein n=1 Tax=Solidesulfovibrio sp. TaxID=2910990 RepID=UPI003158B34A